MTTLAAVQALLPELRATATLDDLGHLLEDLCRRLRFRHFAMVQHVDFGASTARGFRVHNYPEPWVDWFDSQGLGVTDPVHRASHTTLTAFRWSDVPAMIPLSRADRQVLEQARGHGLANGFTVPAHVPGETLGSCSFATAANDDLDEELLPIAQLAGQFAFEAGRRLAQPRRCAEAPALTPRQLE